MECKYDSKPTWISLCLTPYQTEDILSRFFDLVKSLIPTIPDSNTKSKCVYELNRV